jgi:hypothetical protein
MLPIGGGDISNRRRWYHTSANGNNALKRSTYFPAVTPAEAKETFPLACDNDGDTQDRGKTAFIRHKYCKTKDEGVAKLSAKESKQASIYYLYPISSSTSVSGTEVSPSCYSRFWCRGLPTCAFHRRTWLSMGGYGRKEVKWVSSIAQMGVETDR